ncbi:MAG: tRNA 2-thiouridine(34) synthase MnmA [Phycisphaerales bacterium]|nr:tRNA 2-thiouridine(34) synthase MnmA [Phycisphaerales bacterium]
MNRGKVLLAMSGGVDSSVAAAILVAEGWDVVGCFMRLGSEGESLEPQACRSETPRSVPLAQAKIHHRGCCSVDDAHDARRVASHLGTPFYVLNFKRDFGRVIDYFVDEYSAGRTPNPCIRCNDWLKFGRLHDFADEIGATHVASGHYATIGCDHLGQPTLRRGIDHDKDQSYVLFGVARARLASMLLPIGALKKSAVRQRARDLRLPVAEKPDSQEICFVPSGDYGDLLASRSELRPGSILDCDGTAIGTHSGHQRFTIGQRKGLGIAAGEPLYVIAKDAAANTVTLGPRDRLACRTLTAGQVNWLEESSEEWSECSVQWRAHGTPARARVRALAAGASSIEIIFNEPQHAVAPGQAAVCYQDDRIICGGWIESVARSASSA